MSARPQLPSGLPPGVDNRDELIEELQKENRELRLDASRAQSEIAQLRKANGKAVGALRNQLLPLYRALQAVFGEMEELEMDPPVAGSPKVSQVWESWKQKLGGKQAEVIQALLEHGEMNVQQLRVATHSGQQTVYDVTSKLFRLGLLNKNGGRYSLKQL